LGKFLNDFIVVYITFLVRQNKRDHGAPGSKLEDRIKSMLSYGGRRGAPWRFARFIHEAVSGYVIIFEKGFSFATSNTKEA
jgi:transposase